MEKEKPTFLEWIKGTFGCEPIPNPYAEKAAMVIVSSMGRTMMGGIDDLAEGLLTVYLPLMFSEAPGKRSAEGVPLEIILQLNKHFASLKLLDWTLVRPDFIYIMKRDRRHDLDMALKYGDAIKRVRSNDSDIEVPEKSGIILPGGGVYGGR